MPTSFVSCYEAQCAEDEAEARAERMTQFSTLVASMDTRERRATRRMALKRLQHLVEIQRQMEACDLV